MEMRQIEMIYLGTRSYDKKDKQTGNKTGEKGNILQLALVDEETKQAESQIFFPEEPPGELIFGDVVLVEFDITNLTMKPKFLRIVKKVEKSNFF